MKGYVGILLAGLVSSSYAATDLPAALPSSVDPARAGQQIFNPSLPQKITPTVQEKRLPAFQSSPEAQKIHFLLHEIQLSGNTVFTDAQLRPLFAAELGKEVTLADLQKIAHEITLQYRDAGYVLSRAILPAQVIDKGVVQIRIIEGFVGVTRVQGETAANPLLEKYGAALKQQKPLKMSTLERYALLANDTPGMLKVKTVLQPPAGAAEPGATEVLFSPEFSRASGFVGYDNRGTRYLGPNEFSAGGAFNSLIQAGDQLGMQALTSSDGHELRYFNAYMRQPIAATGATFDLSANDSRTEPGYLLAPLKVRGHSQEIVTDIDMPWIRGRKQSLYTLVAFDYLNNKTDINAFNFNLYDDHLRSLRIALNYYVQDKWAGANQLTIQWSKGLPVFGSSNSDQLNLSRVHGDPQYHKWNASLSRLQGITDHISFYMAGIGQYTDNSLLSAEQFAFGGAQYGQAYDPAEFTGDKGIAAKAELRYNAQPGWRYLNNIQYFAFYDIGKIWNILPATQTGLPQTDSAASTGAGFRVNFNQYIFGTAEVAQPLTREVAAEQSFAPRIFVSLTFTGRTHNENSAASPLETLAPGYGDGSATNGATARTYSGLGATGVKQ